MASTANLTKALALGSVIIKKVISGQVRIRFQNPNVAPLDLGHNFPVDILTHCTVEDCRASNLQELVVKGFVTIVTE